MATFRITETISFEVEADTAQDAIDDWLTNGEQAKGYTFCDVSEREVCDEHGVDQEYDEAKHYGTAEEDSA